LVLRGKKKEEDFVMLSDMGSTGPTKQCRPTTTSAA